jgi:hypothetical protein
MFNSVSILLTLGEHDGVRIARSAMCLRILAPSPLTRGPAANTGPLWFDVVFRAAVRLR